ncbi:unnamed protein product [Lymnaea stagnalis]|uniref:Uncharacterized protein n=1 Tax=Lymnaea stagnalis TaxID=6523 RepID=A0AAV2IHH5_LYMST
MALKDIVALSLVIVLAMADSDPRAAFCQDKCDDFEALERRCIEEKDCYESGFNDDTVTCLEECWPVAAPCRKACFDSFDTCGDQCPTYGNSCFEDCFQKTFTALRPELPDRW